MNGESNNPPIPTEVKRDGAMNFVSYIAGHDPDTVKETGNKGEKQIVTTQAITLIWAFAFATGLWWAYLRLLVDPYVAVAIAVFIGTGIFLLDRSIVTSDWSPQGVLRKKNWYRDASYWTGLVVRILLAYVLAYATATGAITYLYKDQIVQWLEHDRQGRNDPLIKEYQKKVQEEQGALVKTQMNPLQKDLDMLNNERDAMLKQVADATKAASGYQSKAAAMRIEADRELSGGKIGSTSYVAGPGARFAEAKRQEREAARAVDRADQSSKASQGRMSDIDRRIDVKQKEVETVNQQIVNREKDILVQRDNDPRWIKSATGPLALQIGLNGLKKDTVYGEVVSDNAVLLKAVIIIFELIPVLCKTLFASASILPVMYTRRVKEAAALHSAEFARNRAGVGQAQPRPDLHVAGGRQLEPDDPLWGRRAAA